MILCMVNRILFFNKYVVAIDALFILFSLCLPIISHILPFPLYVFEPMRLMLFSVMLLGRSKNNTLFMALLLPLLSCVFTNHPYFIKSILISIELIINVLLFYFLTKKINVFFSVIISIIISKLLYYIIKYMLIITSIIDGELISTPWYYQLSVMMAISILFAYFGKFLNKNERKVC